jgi:murein DD-endopeptidase MepM/ murein hydrolase activator NlpD
MSNESVKRLRISGFFKPFLGLSLTVAAVSGGCSADVSRFNLPSSLSFNGDPSSTTTGALAAPTEPVRERSNLLGAEATAPVEVDSQPADTAYMPPRTEQSSDVRQAALPAQPSSQAPAYNRDTSAPPLSVASDSPSLGETIEVQAGDTLYGLSRRHHVSLSELMAVNALKNPNLKPGQKLILPASRPTREAALKPLTTTDAAPAIASSRTASEAAPAAAAEPAPSDWTGTYVVKPGDSLYGIARANKLKFTDLQRFNGIQDVRRVKPGTVLKVPASASNAETNTASAVTAEAPAAPQSNTWNATAPVQQPTTILNSTAAAPAEKQVAANATTSATDASPVSSGSGSVADNAKLRWPVQGKIISGFGQRPDGTHNDGINIAVPLGTDIHAAEGGVVAYAGNELKGYGNLILLRHDNGWVTAYAHSDELLVRRGDKIKRGQVIAKAGKSGQVDQPQLHFELRQGQQPVDPSPHLERL